MKTSRRILFVPALLLVYTVSLFAADIRVPHLEMITRASVTDEKLQLTTLLDLELLLEGGYKFGADVGFQFHNRTVERDPALSDTYDPDDSLGLLDNTLRFSFARAITRDIFDAPMDLVYFTGTIDRFASGRELQRHFGTRAFASDFYGFRYFPDGVQYDGIHGVRGTGLQLRGPTRSSVWIADVYLYQDEQIEPGVFSSDVRAMFNLPRFKMEAFLGATFPQAAAGVYRGGLMAFLDTELGGEFLVQLGLPYWAPDSSGIDLTLDDFFLLVEPRIRFDNFGIFLTLFWHPAIYLQRPTGEEGSVDLNLKLLVGNPQSQKPYGGVDQAVLLSPDGPEQIQVTVSPFLRLAMSGVLWDFTLRSRIYPFDIGESFEAIFGIRTEF